MLSLKPYNVCDALRKQALNVIVNCISIVKKIAKDGRSGILMPFGVKKQNATLAAYGIANNVPHKKNIV